MRPTRRTPAQRRSDAAPLALVLAGWALAVAPIAHPVLAHGLPFLRVAADERWVQHDACGNEGRTQVPVLAAIPTPVLQTVVLASRAPPPPAGLAPTLPRRWSQEQPQAP
jgi:hypothetical protein